MLVAVRMLCCLKVLEMTCSFPDSGVTGSLNSSSFCQLCISLFAFHLDCSFSGINNIVELRILNVDGNREILLSKFV